MRLQQLRTLPIVKLKYEVSISNLRKEWRFCAVFFSVQVSQNVFDLSNIKRYNHRYSLVLRQGSGNEVKSDSQ